MEELLKNLGFKDKEVKIYLAMLQLGTATISAIAKRAGINRTTSYDIIYELEKEGLVNLVGGTKKQTYSAEPPEKLPLLLKTRSKKLLEQADKAESLLPQLKLLSQHQTGQPKVSLFEGVNRIKSLYEDTLLTTEPIRSFSSTESLEAFDPEYLHGYYKERTKKGVFIKAIINDVPSAHEYKSQDKELNREIHIVPKAMMDITPEVYIYDNKVNFFSLAEKFAIQVESWDIATALKKLYDLAWDQAGKLDKKNSSPQR